MASVNFDLSDIKPLIQKLGLGQAPDAAKPVDQLPPPPMQPPQPTPAVAGFSEWSADPQNQQKVAHGITPPGQPIIPSDVRAQASLTPPPTQTPQMASVAGPPSMPSPTLPNVSATPDPLQTKLQADRGELNRLQTTGSGASQVKNPWLHGIAKFGDVASNFVLPALGLPNGAASLPGTTAHNVQLQRQKQGQIAGDQEDIKDSLANQDTQSQTAQRNADAAKKNQQADDLTPFALSPAQAAAINQPALAGTTATMRDYNRLLGMAGNNNTSTTNNQNTNNTRASNNQNNNDTKKSIADAANERMKGIADAANKTKQLIAAGHDATSRSNNANTVANKGSNGAGGFKVPADVTKRAALAANVNENADAVEQLLNKRPDMLGSEGGRYTNVQQMIGSNDPDIHEMGVRMHNIALASNGAHGVRAAGAIQKTEDELFNNFKSGPQGIAGSLKATRDSMQTFLNDEQNFANSGRRTGGLPPPPTGGGDTIKVQIPGQAPGTIHASQLAAFKAKYPNATVTK